ncbi:hypothetical protein [Klenkia terrae]
MTCRLCGSQAWRVVVDLGPQPPCEDFLTAPRSPATGSSTRASTPS